MQKTRAARAASKIDPRQLGGVEPHPGAKSATPRGWYPAANRAPGHAGLTAALGLWAIASVAGAASISPDADGRGWDFRVYLDDKPIGRHTFELAESENGIRLTTRAEFEVKLLFITAFRYQHDNVELWRNGCLTAIDASTDSNGRRLTVSGSADDGSFSLTSGEGSNELEGCVRSFAYWNPAILSASKLLNSQTGEYEQVQIGYDGTEALTVAGESVAAERYTLSAEAGDILLWYRADDATWLALEAPAKGGRRLRYEPVRLPGPSAVPSAAATD